MKKLFYIIFFIGVLLFQRTIFCQSVNSSPAGDTTNLSQGRQEEILLDNLLDECEDSKLLDFLEELKKNSLDLNTVSQEELETIPFINSIIAKNIIDYRKENNSFRYKRGLLNVEGINEQIYELIKPYVVVRKSDADFIVDEEGKILKENTRGKQPLFNNAEIRYRSRFQQDLQTREGYLNGNYPGSKAKIYNRLSFIFDKSKYILSGNLTTEKDAGEKNLTDFVSGYVELKNSKYIRSLIVGDYNLKFGQGLGLWSGTGFSKGGSSVEAVKKRGRGLSGYSSANESQFFRGIASDLFYRNFDLFLFYSNNYFDASIDTTLDEISSFYFDGYHRTISEQNRKRSAKESILGSRLAFSRSNLKLGLTYWSSDFSKQVGIDSSRQLYNFSGNYANMFGFDYDYIFKNINLYGELARSQSGTVAGLAAFDIALSKIASLVFLYRNYPEDFSPVHSFGFGDKNGGTQNENGFYSGISLVPYKGLEINAYFDQFKFPYRSYLEPTSISGNDFLVNINWNVKKELTLHLRFKEETKEGSTRVLDEFGRDVKTVDNREQMNVRLGFDYEITNRIRIRSRYDYVFVKYDISGGSNKGNMYFADFRFIPLRGINVSTRFIFFETDSYDSRLYEYEEDIRGVMSNVGLYGKGRRWYVMMKAKPLNYIEISAKYSETYLDGLTSIGSGNDLIHGDTNNKINLGLEVLF